MALRKFKATKSGSPTTLDELEKFEHQYSITIPGDFKEFLIRYNPLYPDDEFQFYKKSDQVFGIGCFLPLDSNSAPNLEEMYKLRLEQLKGEFIQFAADDGNWYFLLSLKNEDFGKVFFMPMHEDIETGLKYLEDSFGDFLNALVSEDDI